MDGISRQETRRHLSIGGWLILVFIMLAAFGLYGYQLDGQSIWRDEILSIGRARQDVATIFSNTNIIQGVASPDLHPPLYFLTLHFWRELAGESEFAYRFPSVLFGMLSLALFFAVGRRIWGRETGIWAVLLAALSPFYLWYAQEARMYALLALESLLVLYTAWPLFRSLSKKRELLYFGLAAFLTIYTHYSGIILVAAMVLLIVLAHMRMQWPAWWKIVLGLVGIAVLAIPLYANMWTLIAAPGFLAFGRELPWDMLAEAVNTFSLGSAVPFPDPGWRIIPFIVLAVVGALALDISPPRRRKHVLLISIGGLLGTVLLFSLASLLQANYSNPRHLMVLSPIWFLLMGHGMGTLHRRWGVVAVVVGLAVFVSATLSLWQTITDPPVIRDDVRSLAAFIENRAQPGDSVIWHDAVMGQVYAYYADDMPHTAIPRYAQRDKQIAFDRLVEWGEKSQRIWFVSVPGPEFFDQTVIPDALNENWVRMEGVNFPASWVHLAARLYRPMHVVDELPVGTFEADLHQDDYYLRGVWLNSEIEAGNGTWLSLFWQLKGAPVADPPPACVRLRDSQDILWADGCADLAVPGNVSNSIDGLIEQQLWLPVALGTPPITFDVELLFGEKVQELGVVSLQRPLPTPDLTPIATYENGLELVGVNWADDQFLSGLWVLGDVIWHVEKPVENELTGTVQVVDWLGRPVAENSFAIAPSDYPIDRWQAGDSVRQIFSVQLPFDSSGNYYVRIKVNDADGVPLQRQSLIPGREWIGLGWIEVSERPFITELPQEITLPADNVMIGEGAIRFAGSNISREDDNLTVELYWQALHEVEENVGVFIHIGSQGKPPITQGGGPDFVRPVTSWRPGEIIHQTYIIQLPPDSMQEEMSIIVGMYDLDRPEVRLPITINGEPALDNTFELAPLPK